MVTRTTCQNCKNSSERVEPFLDISLDIDTNSSLTHCIKKISKEELL